MVTAPCWEDERQRTRPRSLHDHELGSKFRRTNNGMFLVTGHFLLWGATKHGGAGYTLIQEGLKNGWVLMQSKQKGAQPALFSLMEIVTTSDWLTIRRAHALISLSPSALCILQNRSWGGNLKSILLGWDWSSSRGPISTAGIDSYGHIKVIGNLKFGTRACQNISTSTQSSYPPRAAKVPAISPQ